MARRMSGDGNATLAAIPTNEGLTRVASIDQTLNKVLTKELGQDVVQDAKAATQQQTTMTVKDALRRYPAAVGWSIVFSTAIVMEGYDLVMINSFYAQDQFNRYYGELQSNGEYGLSPAWQAGLSNAVQVGSILGLMMNGYLLDKFGYRRVMLGALVAMVCFIFITFFSVNVGMLLAGELLCGFPWGIFQTLTTTYASEICPVALRPYLCTYVNLCWVFGQFIASGILRGTLDIQSNWAFRIPFALQWFWPIPIFIGVILAPESPWWLVRQNRLEDAKRALRRFTARGAETEEEIDSTVAMMVHTNELEKQISAGTTYLDCFKGIDLRRTEIGCIVWLIQAWGGGAIMGYSTYFFLQAGLARDRSFDLSMVQYALGAIGTILSWPMMRYVGRRKIYLIGMVIAEVLLIGIGCTGVVDTRVNLSAAWAAGALLLIFTFVYDLTVGPVCYALVAEMSSTRLRAKSVVLARNIYNMGGIINNIIVPRMLNPDSWNWRTKSGFFYAGVNLILLVWAFFRLPEPKGRTFGQLDTLFHARVPARKFASTNVDQYDTSFQSEEEKAAIRELEKNQVGGGH